MGASPVTGLSICSGIGGLELGVRLVLPGLRVIAYCERDAPAAQTLARRMDDGAFDPAPIWSDVTRFDGERWAGSVDLVLGGIPCQPFSVAGKGKGQDDERWIWPDIWRWVRDVRPSLIFLENVPGFIRHGLPTVLGDLAEAGFAAEWGCFSAADVGAPHRRERVFVLAHAGCAGNGAIQHIAGTSWAAANSGDGCEAMAHADRQRQQERQPAIAGRAQHAATFSGGGELADTDIATILIGQEAERLAQPGGASDNDLGNAQGVAQGQRYQSVQEQPGIQTIGFGRGLFPPGPADRAGWAAYTERGGPEPAICRGADGAAGRVDRLHALGNAVVPLVAGYAFATLAQALGLDIES